MLCNSTFLIDNTTNISPKLDELNHILHRKLNIRNTSRKVVVFTVWKKMLNIIAKMMERNKTEFLEITGKTAPGEKDRVMRQFSDQKGSQILLLTDEGAGDLDLSPADTIIHFEAPLCSTQKELRLKSIGKMDNPGKNLTMITLSATDSIESWAKPGSPVSRHLIDRLMEEEDNADPVWEWPPEYNRILETELTVILEKLKIAGQRVTGEKSGVSDTGQTELDFSDEDNDTPVTVIDSGTAAGIKSGQKRSPAKKKPDPYEKQLKKVLKNGVAFLSELIKLGTDKTVNLKEKSIELDTESGEITLKFTFEKPSK